MRARLIGSMIAAVAALFLTAPTSASAATECGATAEQWIGSFDGNHVFGWRAPIPLSIEVTRNAEGTIRVTTDVDGTIYPEGGGSITLNRLSWIVSYPEGSFVPWSLYTAGYQGVTCSGGLVTSFTGSVSDYFPGYGFMGYSDLELARVS